LLPVPHILDAETETRGKFRLAQSEFAADRGHVDFVGHFHHDRRNPPRRLFATRMSKRVSHADDQAFPISLIAPSSSLSHDL